MESSDLSAGDNTVTKSVSPRYVDKKTLSDQHDVQNPSEYEAQKAEDATAKVDQSNVTTQLIEDNETKLKERIAQCRNIIESLKSELNEEKTKLEKQNRSSPRHPEKAPTSTTSQYVPTSNTNMADLEFTPNMYSEFVDSRLICDENLIEYEKQLQKYQNTLNMAQVEKKNAIRRQMMAKAYRLKLLEVENQCNIELLRVKQSLQCLQPLQMIASKWKTNSTDATYDVSNLELIPRYPELNGNTSGDIKASELNTKDAADKIESFLKEDSVSSE